MAKVQKKKVYQFVVSIAFDKKVSINKATQHVKDSLKGEQFYTSVYDDTDPQEFKIKRIQKMSVCLQMDYDSENPVQYYKQVKQDLKKVKKPKKFQTLERRNNLLWKPDDKDKHFEMRNDIIINNIFIPIIPNTFYKTTEVQHVHDIGFTIYATKTNHDLVKAWYFDAQELIIDDECYCMIQFDENFVDTKTYLGPFSNLKCILRKIIKI